MPFSFRIFISLLSHQLDCYILIKSLFKKRYFKLEVYTFTKNGFGKLLFVCDSLVSVDMDI